MKNPLTKKLEAALKAMKSGNGSSAIGTLRAVQNQVSAQSGKKITAEEAERIDGIIEDLKKSIQE